MIIPYGPMKTYAPIECDSCRRVPAILSRKSKMGNRSFHVIIQKGSVSSLVDEGLTMCQVHFEISQISRASCWMAFWLGPHDCLCTDLSRSATLFNSFLFSFNSPTQQMGSTKKKRRKKERTRSHVLRPRLLSGRNGRSRQLTLCL